MWSGRAVYGTSCAVKTHTSQNVITEICYNKRVKKDSVEFCENNDVSIIDKREKTRIGDLDLIFTVSSVYRVWIYYLDIARAFWIKNVIAHVFFFSFRVRPYTTT